MCTVCAEYEKWNDSADSYVGGTQFREMNSRKKCFVISIGKNERMAVGKSSPIVFDKVKMAIQEVQKLFHQGIDVLQIGCGNGRELLQLAEGYPNSRFTGYDISQEDIFLARWSAIVNPSQNIRFKVQNAGNMKERNKYDLIVGCDHSVGQIASSKGFQNINRALKEEGIFLWVDCNLHEGSFGEYENQTSESHSIDWNRTTITKWIEEAGFETGGALSSL